MDTVNQLDNKKADTDPPYYQSSQFKEMLRRLVNVTFSPARIEWRTRDQFADYASAKLLEKARDEMENAQNLRPPLSSNQLQ